MLEDPFDRNIFGCGLQNFNDDGKVRMDTHSSITQSRHPAPPSAIPPLLPRSPKPSHPAPCILAVHTNPHQCLDNRLELAAKKPSRTSSEGLSSCGLSRQQATARGTR